MVAHPETTLVLTYFPGGAQPVSTGLSEFLCFGFFMATLFSSTGMPGKIRDFPGHSDRSLIIGPRVGMLTFSKNQKQVWYRDASLRSTSPISRVLLGVPFKGP